MRKKEIANGVAACVGAVVGAGFASGREIMAFFSRFGAYSWAGVVIAALVMGFLCLYIMRFAAASLREICESRMGRWAKAGETLFALLLVFTAASMLCAAGELAALTMPAHHAYEISLIGTLGMGTLLIRRDLKALFMAGKLLFLLLVAAFVLCCFVTGEPIESTFTLKALTGPVAYGAMNIALCVPILCEVGKGKKLVECKRIALFTGVTLFALLALANAALKNQAALVNEPLPVVQLLRAFGLFGFYLCAVVMYLAVFTTLLSCLRGLYQLSPWLCIAPLAAAFIGFERIVGGAYPLLGYACVGLMAMWQISFFRRR